MNCARQYSQEAKREIKSLDSGRNIELPFKRPFAIPGSDSPVPIKRFKQRNENLETNRYLESEQNQREEFKKNAFKEQRILSNAIREMDACSTQMTSDLVGGKKINQRLKSIRTDFPIGLLIEFPFLASPREKEVMSNQLKFTGEQYERNDVQDIIYRTASR